MKKIKTEKKDPTEGFEPIGIKDCEMKCNREVRITENGPVVVCHGCKRVVIDNRRCSRNI